LHGPATGSLLQSRLSRLGARPPPSRYRSAMDPPPAASAPAAPDAAAPLPTLGAREALAIAVGIVVGAGIFRTPSLVASAAASERVFLVAWVVGGVLSMIGALCYAEL